LIIFFRNFIFDILCESGRFAFDLLFGDLLAGFLDSWVVFDGRVGFRGFIFQISFI